jgi:hypothetical protein
MSFYESVFANYIYTEEEVTHNSRKTEVTSIT